MKIKLQHLEPGWHVIALTLLSGAFVPLWRLQTVGESAAGDPVQQVVLLVAYSGLILLVFHRRQIGQILIRGWLIWLLVTLAFVSVLWSQAPNLTLRRSIALLFATLYGCLLALRYPWSTVLKILSATMAIIIGTSAFSIALGAEWAAMAYPMQGWQGIMFHKNALGRIAVLALLVFSIAAQHYRQPWRLGWYGLALTALILIIGSNSTTALITLIALALAGMAIGIGRLIPSFARWRATALSLSTILPVAVLGWMYLPDILKWFGRDPSLTGRVPLWQTLIPIGMSSPLLGYGFGAFWIDPTQMLPLDMALMRVRFGWAGHAHNGYLDLWLELGVIGLLLALLIIFWIMYKSFQQISQSTLKHVFFLMFLIFLIIYNVSEAVLTDTNLGKSIFWIVFSYTYFSYTFQANLVGRSHEISSDFRC
ncbi:MAG: O-antigen polymerase [Chloroflexus sp.]|nr:MAG: O-antigen polymerase [Chloroflexus sp.]